MLKYYLFAGFLFLLFVGLLFIIKMLFNNKQKNSNKDEKLLRLYRQIEDMLESFEEYVSEIKKEITNDKASISKVLGEIDENLEAKVRNILQENQNFIKKNKILPLNNKAKDPSDQEIVRQMHEEGLKINDIAKKANLNCSEVELIIGVNN